MGAGEVLTGANTSVGVRDGDTVRRPTGHWTAAVHALLEHLRLVGFLDAPNVLGLDYQGREVLLFVDGEVALAAGASGWRHGLPRPRPVRRSGTGWAGSTTLSRDSYLTPPCAGGWSRDAR